MAGEENCCRNTALIAFTRGGEIGKHTVERWRLLLVSY